MKLYEINFDSLYFYATDENDLETRVHDFLSRISTNDLTNDQIEYDRSMENFCDIVNEDDQNEIKELTRQKEINEQIELEKAYALIEEA
ncbi:MAG: hypothetical protein GOVbin4318_17 [Prokaryotic dsDNA virus sp.]|nr:MAG: hypothetical protein GOVbin4318_17 [Prokaryotic dsDNA virus sp.]|tara:strand:+ start:114 stop:380 length:267 start_codon:yes stop_codon:yes gene_type:complete